MNIKVGTVYIDVEPDVSKFSEKLRKKLQDTDLGGAVERTLDKASQSVAKFGKNSDKTSVSIDKIGDKTTNFNNKMLLLRNTLSLIKIPAVFAGVGLAAQALLALAAGAIAVVAAFGPLAGLVITMPAGLLAIAAAATTVKLGFKGVSEELKLLSKNAEETVSVAAKEFALFLYSLKPLKDELQAIASSNLLPGIARGMAEAFSPDNISASKSIIADTAQTLGGLATRLGQEFSNPAWAQDLLTISETSTRAFESIGGAVIGSLLPGLRELLIAGQPLIRWLTDVMARGAELIGIWAGNAAASGKAAKFFQETADITSLLGGILGNLFSSLINIGKAAYPLGKGILVALNEQLAKLSEWAKSAGGQQSLQAYFAQALPTLRSATLLVGALAKTFFAMGQSVEGSGLPEFMDRIRTEVLPLFESAITGSEGLGQALLDMAIAAGKFVAIILSVSGPITAFALSIAKVADAIANLVSKNPFLAEMLTTFLGIAALAKVFNLTKVITSILATVASLRAQAASANIATTAQMRLNYAMRANIIGIIATAVQLLVVGFILLYKRSETFRGAVQTLFGFLRDVGVVVLKVITFQFRLFLRAMEAIVEAASHLPFVGDKFKGVAEKIKATRQFLDGAIDAVGDLGKASSKTGDDIKNMATEGSGAIVSLAKVMQGKLKSAQVSLGRMGSSLTTTFQDLSSKALKAFDANTSSMLDNLTVKVTAYGKSWVMKSGDLTPAERELAALDKAEAKRDKKLQRDRLQSELKTAKGMRTTDQEINGKIVTIRQGPDKERIKQINEELRKLNLDDKRDELQSKAVVERKAADAALEVGRRNLQAERDIQRDHFEKELVALQQAVAKGRLTQERFRNETLALLAKYGVSLKVAGQQLGNAFAGSLNKSMQTVQVQAGKTSAALQKILDLRKEIAAAEVEDKKARGPLSIGKPAMPITPFGDSIALRTADGMIVGQYVAVQTVSDESVAREIGASAARKVRRR